MIYGNTDLWEALSDDRLKLDPFSEESIRENGIDLKLGREMALLNKRGAGLLDPTKPEELEKLCVVYHSDLEFVLPGLTMGLFVTREVVSLSHSLMGLVQLRSSWARLGLLLPPTVVDAGFSGTLTLEVFNASTRACLLRPGQRFCHLVLFEIKTPGSVGYQGSFQGQRSITLPRCLDKESDG